MEFQFLCPQGHLLQGDESQTGRRCKCPYCQSEFFLPQASRNPQPDHLPVARTEASGPPPVDDKLAAAPEPAAPPETFPEIHTGTKVSGLPSSGDENALPNGPGEVAAQLGFGDPRRQDLLHIPCPKGHVLETPRDLLGQDAMCPFCQAEFRLRLKDSQEYQREQAEQRERQEQKLGKAWLHWAIATAVVVVFGLVLLVAFAVSR